MGRPQQRAVILTPYYEEDGVTIYHGDALFVLPQLKAESVDLVATDPPYSSGGAMRSDRTMSTVAKYVQSTTRTHRPEFSGDNRDQRSYAAWCSLWLAGAHHVSKTGGLVACFTDWRQLPTTTDAVQMGGWVWRGLAVWDKGGGVRPTMGSFRSQSEFIVWGSKGAYQPRQLGRAIPGVFTKGVVRDRAHIAQKPVEVMRWVVDICPEGGTVLDPFMGSGTTLRAAKDCGHPVIGIEADEAYCEHAAKRLAQESLFGSSA